MTELVDFTSCSRVPGRAYNGANGKKIAVNWRGACWILKFPPSASNGTGTELSSVPETIDRQDFVDPVVLRRFYVRYLVARHERLFRGKI